MSPHPHERPPTIETRAGMAADWLAGVRAGLQNKADRITAAGYLTAPDVSIPPTKRKIPGGVIDAGADRFLTALEERAQGSEHIRDRLATLEDRRAAFLKEHGFDIGGEQFEVIREFLDTPEFYNQ